MFKFNIISLTLLGLLALPLIALAREPGIANSFVPGITIGTPVAAPLPPGFRFNNDANFYNARVTAATSASTSTMPTSKTLATTPKFIWSGPANLMPRFQMWIAQPIIYAYRYTPVLNQSASRLSLGNTILNPIILSWQLMPALYFSTMLSINVPDGQYDKNAYINLGYPFWTVSPEMGVSYLTEQMNLTIHLIYSFNSINHQTGYRSASQLFADLTGTKKWGSHELGIVGYYDQQIGADYNSKRFYQALQRSKPLQFAVGALYGFAIHKVSLQFYATYDVLARDGALKGYRIFSRLRVPIS